MTTDLLEKELKKHNEWLNFASKCKLTKDTDIVSIPSLLSECTLTNDACRYESCPFQNTKVSCTICPKLFLKSNRPYCRKLKHYLENGFAMRHHNKHCGESVNEST